MTFDARRLVETLDAYLGSRSAYFADDNEGQYPFRDFQAAEDALIAQFEGFIRAAALPPEVDLKR